jgi:flagella synthesis protein FlgN
MSITPLACLREEHQLIASLLDVLKQEQRHLVGADIDKLTLLTPQKSALVGRMAMLANQRHAALGAAGFKASESGMESWVAASAAVNAQAEAPTLWRELLASTHEAKELNRINGMLINKHMGHTQEALKALRPQAATANSFYGPSGHATTSTTSRGFLAG